MDTRIINNHLIEQAERMAEKWDARADAFWHGGDVRGYATAGFCKTPEEAEKAHELAADIRNAIARMQYGEGTKDDYELVQRAVADRDGLDAGIRMEKDIQETNFFSHASVGTGMSFGSEKQYLTVLAEKTLKFHEEYDPAFGYAEGVPGQETPEQWRDTFTKDLLQNGSVGFIESIQALATDRPEIRETAQSLIEELKPYGDHPLDEKSSNISVHGHHGTWYVIDSDTIDGNKLFLLESEQYGDEVPALIVDDRANLLLDSVYNGFNDYREQVERQTEVNHRDNAAPEDYRVSFLNPDGEDDYIRVGGFENFSDAEAFYALLENEGYTASRIHQKPATGDEINVTHRIIITDDNRDAILKKARDNTSFIEQLEAIKILHPVAFNHRDNVTPVIEQGDTFTIYQLKGGDETRGLRFSSFGDLEARGIEIAYANYNNVYSAPVTIETNNLNKIYDIFNLDHPNDFKGHSLSVSDVVVLNRDGKETAFYIDSVGYRELPDFITQRQAEYHRDNAAPVVQTGGEQTELSPKDKLKEQLETGIKSVLDSEIFKNWLSTGGKLFYNNYSFRNALLLWAQKPDASHVMGYEAWKSFGRNVGQGIQGAKIFVPIIASEKYKGGLASSIKKNLNEQLAKDPTLTVAKYRLGQSTLEFTMNRANRLIGVEKNGREARIFGSDGDFRRFIDSNVIGKVPTGYTAGTVFDEKDVIVPEYLWIKKGFSKEEIVTDDKGKPVQNKRGETKIINTSERQARFQPTLDTTVVAKDPDKMEKLLAACIAVSEGKGVTVRLSDKESDTELNDGSSGYFHRPTEEYPNGFIVLNKDLEITEKCAVLFHEMGHADLHKDLNALAEEMGETKISREMREVQAEAVAFSVASTFGIETNTSSFNYLAVYSTGFELQDFQKSLDVIYKETQALTADIKAELDMRGLNLDLTEKPKEILNKETLVTLSQKYVKFAAEQGSNVQVAFDKLPSLIRESKGNPELVEVLKYQKENLDKREADIGNFLAAVETLNKAATRDKQDELINTLDTAMNRISGDMEAFIVLSERFAFISEQEKGGLKVDFEKAPVQTLESMKADYPELAKLSDPQLQYIAESKVIATELSKLLRDNPQGFVDMVTERANLLPKVAAKNGTFVEVNYCEQWTDKPFFENGTLCSPKIANMIVTGSEAQTRGFKEEAAQRGEYFPYTRCDLTVFSPNKDGGMVAVNTCLDIGAGEAKSLEAHLEKECQDSEAARRLLDIFKEALTERANKNKITVQNISIPPSGTGEPEDKTPAKGGMTQEEWDAQIKEAKENVGKEEPESGNEKNKGKEKGKE